MHSKIQRIILLTFVVLTAVSCKKVTIEQQIDKIYNYFQNETQPPSLLWKESARIILQECPVAKTMMK